MLNKFKNLLKNVFPLKETRGGSTQKKRIYNFLGSFFGKKSKSKKNELNEVKNIYEDIILRNNYKSNVSLKVENIFLSQAGIIVFFHVFEPKEVRVYVMLFETANPRRALWYHPKLITQFGNVNEEWKFLSLEKDGLKFKSLWWSPLLGKQEKIYPSYRFTKQIEIKNALPILFKPHHHNPMIQPHHSNHWEAFTTFNPAAFYLANKVHILYRAQGYDYVSQIGYAVSSDGLTIDKRFNDPIYQPSQPFEGVSLPPGDPNGPYASGGGSGGVEDPRATIIDDKIYMTYVAYNGWEPPRIALTSIPLEDFLNHNFLWKKPVLISPPGIVNKSAVIFPEKIKGKYVVMHRVFPNILIDYVDSLDFTGKKFLKGEHKIEPRSREWWDSRKIGAGAPPLKTKKGWLLIYQATDDKDASEYKVGAMLLNLEDPTKVLARSTEPILLPREEYENVGFKAGVVYPCGAVIKDSTLFVYYGGADSYVCVATAKLEKFIEDLIKTGVTNLDAGMLGVETEEMENLYEK